MTSIQPTPLPQQETEKKDRSSFWNVFFSTFITIFLAEMGDKTQLATLLITAESHSPWVVFTGAATALIATSLMGVAIGVWLAKNLPARVQQLVVGILLLIVSISLLWDAVYT